MDGVQFRGPLPCSGCEPAVRKNLSFARRVVPGGPVLRRSGLVCCADLQAGKRIAWKPLKALTKPYWASPPNETDLRIELTTVGRFAYAAPITMTPSEEMGSTF